MTTRITQIEDQKSNRALLKLEGTLSSTDAELLEIACSDLRKESGCNVAVDLSDIGFITNESAAILCRLRASQGVVLEGMRLFVQLLVEMTEAERDQEKDVQS